MARVKLSDRLVRNLKAGPKRTEYWDETFPGGGSFGIRVSTKGKKSWVLVYREAGRLKWKTLGVYPVLGLAAARNMAKQDLARLRLDGKLPRKSDTKTFQDLADKFLRKHPKQKGLKQKTVDEYQRILDADLLPSWNTRELDSITRSDVNGLLDEIAFDRDSPVMANRTLALVSVMFNFAVDEEWVDVNPCYRIKKRITETSRDRVLSDEEIRRLWRELENHQESTAAIYRLILLTGQRGGEIKAMKWDQILEDLWVIPPELTKNKREHRVPLSQPVLDILECLKAISGASEYVFPSRAGGHTSWMGKNNVRIQEAVNFHFTPHDLRRTCATNLSKMGAEDTLIAKILNHSWVDRNITSVYNRWQKLPEMRQSLELWAHKLNFILEEGSDEKT